MAATSIISAIADRQKRLEALARENDLLLKELETLIHAAKLIGVPVDAPEHQAPAQAPARRGVGGKKPGTISTVWRKVLGELCDGDKTHTLADIKAASEMHGVEAAMPGIKERIRRFIEQGYLLKHEDGTYSVTDEAVRKFSLLAVPSSAYLFSETETPAQVDVPEAGALVG
jgi:hypothetical protein